MDFGLSEEQQLLSRTVREFAEAEIGPRVMEWDEAQQFPLTLVPKLAALGLMGIQFPEAYGGSGMSAVDYCVCIEGARAGRPVDRALGGGPQRSLRRAHLPVRRRDAEASFSRSARPGGSRRCVEPDGGQRGQRCRGPADSRRVGCRWMDDQRRQDVYDSRRNRRHRCRDGGDGSCQRPSWYFRLRRRARYAGDARGAEGEQARLRASDTTEVVFEDCRVPADQLLGIEGDGFVNAMQVLDAGRIGIAALAVGLAQGAYEAARRYATERRQFGQPLASFQAIQ